jgi:membrane glycosyltransferase
MLRLLAGLVLETIIAGLMAPVVMLTQTIDVAAILGGRDSGWNVQRRDGGAIPVRETVRLYRRHTILGLLLGVAAWFVSPYLAAWMLPVVLGLALAIPMVLWTGRASQRAMLLRTPEQTAPPPIVSRAAALQLEWQALAMPDITTLLNDARLLRMHEAMLPPPRRPRIDPIDVTLLVARTKLDEADALQPALAALTTTELAAALGDVVALRRLAALASGDPLVSAAA